jgi:hypothetical protein
MNKNRKNLRKNNSSNNELLFFKRKRREKRVRIIVSKTRIKNIINDDWN